MKPHSTGFRTQAFPFLRIERRAGKNFRNWWRVTKMQPTKLHEPCSFRTVLFPSSFQARRGDPVDRRFHRLNNLFEDILGGPPGRVASTMRILTFLCYFE